MIGAIVGALALAAAGSGLWHLAHRHAGLSQTADSDGRLVMPAGNGLYTVVERDLKTGSERLIGTYNPDQLHAMGLDPIGYDFKDRSIGSRLMVFQYRQNGQ